MRRILPVLAAVLFAASFLTGLAACSGRRLIDTDAVAIASVADVKAVVAQADTDRTNTADGFKAVRDDLAKVNIATEATGQQVGKLDAEIARPKPAPSGVAGALVNAIAGSGVLPGWLDWIVTLGAGALGINVTRNASRKRSLAKVKTEAVLAATGKVPPATPPAP